MNTAQSQELCHIDDMLQGLLNGLAKSRSTANTTRIKQGLLKIQGRVHTLLNTNPMFKERQIRVPKGSNSPVEPSDPSGGVVDVYRPFADVLEGFTHAVAAKATYLKTGSSVNIAVLFNTEHPFFSPQFADAATIAALKSYANIGERVAIGYTVTNRATVVGRK